jgi:periodic tryptophan protein 2
MTDFAFSNLLGAPYCGGSLVLHDHLLLSPVGNRVTQVDLTAASNTTLPFENLSTVKVLALNPSGSLLLSFDQARTLRLSVSLLPHSARRTAERCW